jgi:DNA modification methylase
VEPYYEDDFVTLYHGDCREVTAWLAADVLVTDPPYGVKYQTRRGVTVANDSDFLTTEQALRDVSFAAAAVFANHASLTRTMALVSSLHDRVRVMTWHKSNVNGSAPGNPWLADVEFAVCGVDTYPTRPVSAVVSAPRSTGNPEWQVNNPDAYLHPTQKPLGLMRKVILALPDGTVADPFAGSGSTLRAAKGLGRKAIGVELDEAYCEIAAKRLSQEVLDFGGVA